MFISTFVLSKMVYLQVKAERKLLHTKHAPDLQVI